MIYTLKRNQSSKCLNNELHFCEANCSLSPKRLPVRIKLNLLVSVQEACSVQLVVSVPGRAALTCCKQISVISVRCLTMLSKLVVFH